MKRIFSALFFLLLITTFAEAQSTNLDRLAANIGYQYMHVKSGYLGAEYRLNSNQGKNTNGPLTVGVGTYLYSSKSKFKVTPEIHVNQTWMHFLTTELSASTKNLKPSVGLSVFNLMRFQFGYSFQLGDSNFKGFHFGFNILLGRSSFYDEIKVY